MPSHYRPAPGRELLKKRAEMFDKIRTFMRDRAILEVDTPTLNKAGVPDPNIQNLSTSLHSPGDTQRFYLGTSPEFYMKRLLAAGSGSIFQLCRVFRDDPAGQLHQPEFTMLEWYRLAYDHLDLMVEIDQLLQFLGLPASQKREYGEVFKQHIHLDPHEAGLQQLKQHAREHGLQSEETDRAILLDFLFSHLVIPQLDRDTPVFIYHYPACQAALARLNNSSPACAERFELFYQGMELANGFHELTDATEQRRRFEDENRVRKERGQEAIILDEALLEALEKGMPDCAGVAVGLDRLLMTVLSQAHINDVMTFPLVPE